MRKFMLLLSVVVLLYNCVGNNKNLQQKLIDDKINAGLKSGIRHDTVFLGLRLGDRLEVVRDDLQILLDKKELKINASGQYEYDFLFDSPDSTIVKAQATLTERYYGDKLYQLILKVISFDPSLSFPPVLELNLLDLFTKKYGDDYLTGNSRIDEYHNYKDYYWVDGNRYLELKLSPEGVSITYTDMIIKKLLDSSGEEGRKADRNPG